MGACSIDLCRDVAGGGKGDMGNNGVERVSVCTR